MNSKHILLIAAAAISFTLPILRAQQRFDHLVRNDFFAGFSGDEVALARGMKAAEAALENDPKHAEALVWHGAGLFFQSGQFMQKGDQAKGMELYGQGIGEMKKAVSLAPNSIGVRIPRGSVLLSASRNMPPQMAKSLREDGISDYMVSYELQKDNLAAMGTHPRGELLFGLADAYSRNGDMDNAQKFFDLVTKRVPDSVYSRRAAKWNETKQPLPAAQANCVGCHTAGK